MPLPDAPDYSKRIYELLKETDLENLSYAQFKGVSEKLFIEPENEDEMRRVVLIQLARMAVRGDWDGFLTGGGGSGGAPIDAEYVVMSLNGTLTNERVLAAGTGISLTDGGVGSNATIANTGVTSNVAGTGISVSSATGASTIANTGVTSLGAGDGITLSGSTGGVTVSSPIIGDLVAAQYVTLATDTQLQNERVLTAGSGITLTDGGAGSTITIAASGGGGGGGGSGFLQPPTASGAIASNYNKYPIFASAPFGTADIGSTSSTAFNLYPCMRPFVLGEGGTWGGVAIYVDSASASNFLLISLYESDSDGMPAAFIGYCEISTTSTGSVTQTTTLNSGGSAATFTLSKDTQYWCSFVMKNNSDACTTRSVNVDGLAGLGNSNMSAVGTILRNTNVSNAIETTNPPRNNQIISNGQAPHIGIIM